MSSIYKKLGRRVRALRDEIGMTQEELAKKLEMKRPTISQIEAGDRKLSTDELVKLSWVFNIGVEALLDPKREPHVILEKSTERKAEPQIRINVPQKNLQKFKEVLLYILNRVGSRPNVGEAVIYKLLYFIDFDYYERYEEQLIGASYIKNRYGPTPVEFKKIVNGMMRDREITKVPSRYFQYPQTKYLPLRFADLSSLSAKEIKMIDNVLSRLGHKNASEMRDYSHKDIPWLTTEEEKVIEYESVFYRTAPYSVREYAEEVS
jgi:transcriptional regulator with XRE-family HTH domain